MLLENQNPFNRSIMIALLGKPNVGKSSLINTLLGFDLSIVSSKPQTTRNKFHCAFTIDLTEVIIVDTPGLHNASYEINKRMNDQALEASNGVDLNFILFDLSQSIESQLNELVNCLPNTLSKSWLIFTKSDLIKLSPELIEQAYELIKTKIPSLEKYFVISSKTQDNIHELTGAICDAATEGPHLYPAGDVSNMNERFFASEYIREQAFNLLQDELPYELAVVIDEFKDMKKTELGEKPSKIASQISASILVNRPSQRAIVVGRQGQVIKEIGTKARQKIEAMVGGKVHLNLHVKVSPKWFKNNFVLEELGLPRVKDSARVWRKK
jgi:GTP-binding protein Era